MFYEQLKKPREANRSPYAYVLSHLHAEKWSITTATKTELAKKREDKTKENQRSIDWTRLRQ